MLGVDSSGNVLLWELRAGDGAVGNPNPNPNPWSGGRLLARVKEVGRVHSACLLLDAGRHWVLLCGGDRACVFDVTSRSKRLVLFCALSLQVMLMLVVLLMVMLMLMLMLMVKILMLARMLTAPTSPLLAALC